jgi:hypothetical protein
MRHLWLASGQLIPTAVRLETWGARVQPLSLFELHFAVELLIVSSPQCRWACHLSYFLITMNYRANGVQTLAVKLGTGGHFRCSSMLFETACCWPGCSLFPSSMGDPCVGDCYTAIDPPGAPIIIVQNNKYKGVPRLCSCRHGANWG